ncbi:LOW QUALITY PROTEIN: allene oxide synthase-like [Hibiscus syriacus]|uniref:LOW QUALITY PROTEIN: allene oxide synthase-like n=1 Tax=Hibiscus syriacus TaxID=106335 RepID=UPI00192114E7|nr:LOW QUALITY PROTEIN: allene oxide synthase-like [Hibiscus syriacus]
MAAATSPTSTRSSTHPATVRPVSDLPSEKTGETKLPLKKIPGDYGLPFFGAIKDRLDYFYNQGREEFFKSKIQKYHSTVVRTNMPPGPFISSNPKVIALLDAKSFPVLFDVSKVEKKDLFTGTYMPSTKLTGGYRILSYLDPSEPKHAKIKQLLFFLLKSIKDRVFPEFEACYTELFATVEKEVAAKGKSNFSTLNEQAAFNFLGRAYFGSNPPDTKLGTDGPSSIAKWVLFNLAPVLSLGLPKYIEDLLLHTFPLPAFLVKRDYNKLYDFIYQSSGFVQDEAEKLGLSREEACHNLLFATCFNTYGGVKILFPSILKYIGQAGEELHTKLALEIRSAIKSNGGKLSMAALEQMPLNKSVVYETLRIDPPVPTQYGKAKKDLLIESHDAVFEVKKGEMLFGFQPIATKDRKVFERAEEFVPDRFVGADGEKLLKYVVWSNGPETETPSVANKQCAGKEFVVLIARLLVVQLFKRYDTFEIDVGTSPLGAAITIKSFKRASS